VNLSTILNCQQTAKRAHDKGKGGLCGASRNYHAELYSSGSSKNLPWGRVRVELGSFDGSFGGVMMGVKEDICEVENWETETYSMGATVRDRITNVRAYILIVYGPTRHEWSEEFLKELENRCKDAVLPTFVGKIKALAGGMKN
jgi:hypothetical protein